MRSFASDVLLRLLTGGESVGLAVAAGEGSASVRLKPSNLGAGGSKSWWSKVGLLAARRRRESDRASGPELVEGCFKPEAVLMSCCSFMQGSTEVSQLSSCKDVSMLSSSEIPAENSMIDASAYLN